MFSIKPANWQNNNEMIKCSFLLHYFERNCWVFRNIYYSTNLIYILFPLCMESIGNRLNTKDAIPLSIFHCNVAYWCTTCIRCYNDLFSEKEWEKKKGKITYPTSWPGFFSVKKSQCSIFMYFLTQCSGHWYRTPYFL